ncbi:hypothetical protein V7S43_016764 [Phytophthora oleae]|uniref:Uncharacterized protein n=1 Tax=Phytophthora oleae TaxID=2107226 RepID=A0ABD3EZJ2_9STRA
MTAQILSQNADGVNWTLDKATGNKWLQEDGERLRDHSKTEGIVLEATPLLHRFPWSVTSNIKNRRELGALKKQPFRRYRQEVGKGLKTVVEKLRNAQQDSQWTKAAQGQSPKDLGTRHGSLTDFQAGRSTGSQ